MTFKAHLAASLAALFIALPAPATRADPAAGPVATQLHELQQDIAVARLLNELNHAAPREAGRLVVVRNVRIVEPAAETATPAQSVIVSGARIAWTGDTAKEPKLEGALVIDGQDQFLAPGLTDMHVHSTAAAGWLLELASGVTTVRDMGGFPWLLRVRNSVAAGRMLAPTCYVAGTIINAMPLEGYAVVPRDALDARRIVRQQAACGYDFIKLHNIMPQPMFDAIAEEAARLGMDLVGHVPHDITVRHAVSKGMRTMEHLKGFLDDKTLQLGETDYAAAVDGPEVWNTPTLVALRSYARGAEAQALLARPEMRYVPARRRAEWSHAADEAPDPATAAGNAAREIAAGIVGKLRAVDAKFLAGTDADGYSYLVMGYALLDELDLLCSAGLAPPQALRAATTAAATAMRVPEAFGRIQRGMRADFVLLKTNPLENISAFRANAGVMAHGVWLPRAGLDRALDQLARIQAEPDAGVEVDARSLAAAHSAAQALSRDGFIFDGAALTGFANTLRESGWPAEAEHFDALAGLSQDGPCAQYTPQ